MPTRRKDDCVVQYKDDKQTRDAVFNAVLEFFFKHKSFSGESIMQMDNPQIDAPVVLSEIADNIMGFEWEYDWDKKDNQNDS